MSGRFQRSNPDRTVDTTRRGWLTPNEEWADRRQHGRRLREPEAYRWGVLKASAGRRRPRGRSCVAIA